VPSLSAASRLRSRRGNLPRTARDRRPHRQPSPGTSSSLPRRPLDHASLRGTPGPARPARPARHRGAACRFALTRRRAQGIGHIDESLAAPGDQPLDHRVHLLLRGPTRAGDRELHQARGILEEGHSLRQNRDGQGPAGLSQNQRRAGVAGPTNDSSRARPQGASPARISRRPAMKARAGVRGGPGRARGAARLGAPAPFLRHRIDQPVAGADGKPEARPRMTIGNPRRVRSAEDSGPRGRAPR